MCLGHAVTELPFEKLALLVEGLGHTFLEIQSKRRDKIATRVTRMKRKTVDAKFAGVG
jgi:hypothetical protein